MKVNFKLLKGENDITKANLKIAAYDSSISKKYDQYVDYKNPEIDISNASNMEISRLNNTQKTHMLDYSFVGDLVFDKENIVRNVKSKYSIK